MDRESLPSSDPEVATERDPQKATLDPTIEVPETVEESGGDWSAPTPPGVLEVEVWLGPNPLSGAEVAAEPAERTDSLKMWVDEEDGDLRYGLTDALGIARLTRLPVDGEYAVRVSAGEIVALLLSDRVDREAPFRRMVVRLGTGGVEGRIFHDYGAAWPDRRVFVNAMDIGRSNSFRFVTQSDPSGAYRVGGLPKCFALVGLPEDPETNAHYQAARVRLADGEWRRVDFGSDGPKVHWTGRLRSASGVPFEVAMPIELEEIDRGSVETLKTGADGTVAADLVPGRYRVEGSLFRGETVLGEIEISGSIDEDALVIPGALVSGRLTYVGEWPDKQWPARTAQVWLRVRGETRPQGLAAREDDRFWFLGVAPGEYRITTHPQALVGGDAEGIPLLVSPEQFVIDLDLTIQDP